MYVMLRHVQMPSQMTQSAIITWQTESNESIKRKANKRYNTVMISLPKTKTTTRIMPFHKRLYPSNMTIITTSKSHLLTNKCCWQPREWTIWWWHSWWQGLQSSRHSRKLSRASICRNTRHDIMFQTHTRHR